MHRRLLLFVLFPCALLLVACGETAPVPAGRSVVLVTIDTLRADHLASYGHPIDTMPLVESWARKGVLFEQAWAPMSQTLPSHASLLTGLEPRNHAALENYYKLPADVTTLAEWLGEQGWETCGVVGALVLADESGIAQGFDTWDQPEGEWSADAVHPPERSAAAVVDAALSWAVQRDDAQRPYLLWVHVYDPHGPYEPPEGFRATRDRGALVQHVATQLDEFRGLNREREYTSSAWWSRHPDAPSLDSAERYVADTRWNYVKELEYTDRELARLFEGLERRGMLDDTVVVLASDHGEGLFEHGEKGHGVHVWEELTRVPLIVAAPDGALAGTRVEAPVSLLDVMPTLLSCAGVEAPPDLDGRDLWSGLVAGAPTGSPQHPVFLERPHFSEERMLKRMGPYSEWGVLSAVMSDGFKLVRSAKGAEQLFDLSADPSESADLAAARADKRAALAALLDTWLAEHPTEPPGARVDVSAEQLKRLEDLGYH